MTKFVGRRGTLGIATEASKGTATNPTYWLPWVTMSFADKATQVAESQGMGVIADQDSIYVTLTTGEGDVESQLYDNAIGYILSSLLGAKPNSSGTNPTTHTFTMSQSNVPQTLSLYWKDPDRSYMFPQAVVESLKMSVEPTGIVSWTIHFKSKHARDWTSQVPDFTSLGSKFLHQHLVAKLATSIAGLSAASAISLKNFEMTFDRKTMFDEVIGTAEPEDILSQTISIEGTLELNLEDDTYRNFMLNGNYRAMDITLIRSTSSSLQFQFPRVNFSEWEPDYTIDEIAKQKVNFKANYDSTNALQIVSTAILINSKSSY